MKLAGRSIPRLVPACWITACALTGCSYGPETYTYPHNEYADLQAIPDCDPTLEIAPESRALMVTEPAALQGLPLEDVLAQVLASYDELTLQPTELLQRLFDTSNQAATPVFRDGTHCDSPTNAAHANGPAAFCPRAEGALAASDGFFTPGHPDHFQLVAAVNRFDLMPFSALSCGEARLIYAKESGLTDPDDRVFLIFEMSLPNPEPGNMLACRPVAELWHELEAEPDPEVVGQKLRSFFLEGPPDFGPVVSYLNLGFGGFGGSSYYGASGQLRVSQHMDEHWEMRQFVSSSDSAGVHRFLPTTVANNPLPSRFEAVLDDPSDKQFANTFVADNLTSLGAKKLTQITMTVWPEDLSGESALGGESVNDYAARAAGNQYLHDYLAKGITDLGLGDGCPEDDPLTSESLLRRATMDSCAGCHAPAQFLGPERKIGCGLTWPDSLGEVHIDEQGRRSPALQEVFLPQRAKVLTTYLQACNQAEINEAFGAPPGGGTSAKVLSGQRTIGGRATH
jgi:hypothetical protein